MMDALGSFLKQNELTTQNQICMYVRSVQSRNIPIRQKHFFSTDSLALTFYSAQNVNNILLKYKSATLRTDVFSSTDSLFLNGIIEHITFLFICINRRKMSMSLESGRCEQFNIYQISNLKHGHVFSSRCRHGSLLSSEKRNGHCLD